MALNCLLAVLSNSSSAFLRLTVVAGCLPHRLRLSIGQPLVYLSTIPGSKCFVPSYDPRTVLRERPAQIMKSDAVFDCPVDPTRAVVNHLFVYSEPSSPDRVSVELFTRSPESKKPLRVRLNRPLDETISRFFERLTSSMTASKKQPSSSIECTLYRSRSLSVGGLERIEPCSTVSQVFASGEESDGIHDAIYLLIQSQTDLLYKASFNPARVLKCRLEIRPMVDCPVVPRLETSNMTVEESEFAWFVTKTDAWPSEPCHRGFIFFPTEAHLGGRLGLRIIARDAHGRPGLPFGNAKQYNESGEVVECKWRISASPNQSYHENRIQQHHESDFQENTNLQFRVVSYNLLADMYASMDSARNQIFRHCPLECLDIAYRLPLLLRELSHYHGDILCLQEVDSWVFQYYLKPVLSLLCNMDGVYLAKRLIVEEPGPPIRIVTHLDKEKNEGCAIFYRKSKFELIRQAHLPSILSYAAEQSQIQPLMNDLIAAYEKRSTESNPAFDSSIPEQFPVDWSCCVETSKGHCLLVLVLRALTSGSQSGRSGSTPGQRCLIVANTHLYFHPTGDEIRMLQAMAIRHHVFMVREETQSANNAPVSVIIAGDINQDSKGPAYEVLLGNAVTTDSLKHSVLAPPECPHREFQMRPTYVIESPQFTNWVPDFHAPLDVILYDAHSGLSCAHTYPLCSAEEITRLALENTRNVTDEEKPQCRGQPVSECDVYALPNRAFPSDHLALIADFQWPSAKEDR